MTVALSSIAGLSHPRPARALVAVVVAAVGCIALAGCLPIATTFGYGAGDTRTGWFGNQTTLTPGLVSSGTFGEMWNQPVTGQVYAQPVVDKDTIVAATESNDIYGLDATSGAQKWHRQVGVPFNPNDVSCSDLVPTIGVTGTPVIDSATDTAYFVKKTYVTGSSGPAAYFAHAVDVATGAEKAGFPLRLQGTAANDPTTTFDATKHLQRPGLLLMGGVIYAGFGGHCDRANYQGWVIGFTTAGQISTLWDDEAGETGNPGAGIWQSGGGLVSDAPGQIVVTTGNGNLPAGATPGSTPPRQLGEAVVRLTVQPDHSLKATDFFMPYDSDFLNSWDADLGSGAPVALPDIFGTASTPRLGLQMGKQGYLYVLDETHLGGYRQGPSGSDDIVQRLGPFGGTWSKPGVWPGDGGYVYITTASGGNTGSGTTGVLRAFKYGLDGNAKPTFSLVGSSSDSFGFSSGSPVITSNNIQSGSALVWVVWSPDGSGNNSQLRAYDPIPVNGTMNLRWSTPIGQSSKFSVPVVNGNRVIIGTRDGKIRSFGSPINAALTGPSLSFPDTTIGQSAVRTVTLTANFDQTINALSSNSPVFSIGTSSPPLPAHLTSGQTITVPVTFTPTSSDLASANLTATGTAGSIGVGLSGTGRSSGALITANPTVLSLGGGIVNGSPVTASVTLRNAGSVALTVNSVTPPAAPFSVSGLPISGSSLAPGGQVTATVTFAPTATGVFTDQIDVSTTGGDLEVPVSGTATTAPHMVLSTTSLAYGNVVVGGSKSLSFTVSNNGGGPLSLTKSKPPAGVFAATTTIAEGTTIPAGNSVTGVVRFSPTATGAASATWDITGNDGSGPKSIAMTGTGVTSIPINPPSAGGWQLNGSAALSASNLVLTPNAANLAGSAFWPTAVTTSGFTVAFDETIDQGNGADGLTFTFADPGAGATPTSLGGNGGSLGYSGIPGVAVTFDTYQNGNDPSANFMGIATGGNGDTLSYAATNATVPALHNATRHVVISYSGGVLHVTLDGTVVFNQTVTLPSSALVGWTAGTGGSTDRHLVTNAVFG
jgi:hypothetical protein